MKHIFYAFFFTVAFVIYGFSRTITCVPKKYKIKWKFLVVSHIVSIYMELNCILHAGLQKDEMIDFYTNVRRTGVPLTTIILEVVCVKYKLVNPHNTLGLTQYHPWLFPSYEHHHPPSCLPPWCHCSKKKPRIKARVFTKQVQIHAEFHKSQTPWTNFTSQQHYEH